MPRRNRIDIIESILFLLSSNKNMKPTHLMYRANLSNVQMKGYLEELTKKGFIKKISNREKGTYTLIITLKGIKFREKIKEMREFEEVFGLEK